MHLFLFFITILCFAQAKSNEFTSPKLWNSFKRVHKKQYVNAEEENYRRIIFDGRLAMINQHNFEANLGLHTYTLTINRFSDMTYDEIVRTISNKYTMSLATKISTKSDRQIFRPPSNLSIPATVDWRKRGAVTSIIENQGQCASDWAYTATTALEGQHFLKTGKLVRLSAQNLLDCSGKFGNQGCNGGLVNAAFQYIKVNKGVDTEASYPYEAMEGKCRFNRSTVGATDTGFVNIAKGNETALQIAVATVGPIGVAVDDLHDSFFFYSSGVYDEPACSTKEWSHTMTIVGYDVFNNGTTKRDYYIVKNSWGETWGLNGYIWMSRNKHNQCGIANWASYPLV
ncbi:unnamed protein product [Rotaria magnacalcarata]|uniref:Uncharacterized protein n=1 Tax=Rotaria magnacalcarata TaxID=392030 RepID=A0A819KRZ5_9BILA|nr:unnamed protein product [Rotaria magnacalcarata]CAF3953296.1 unnamed protein product [Rotaria magnacalcarata]